MNKLIACLIVILLFKSTLLLSQISINTDGSTPNSSAMLDVKATDRGMLIPRISTANRDLIPSPATGLLIYNATTDHFNYFNGSYWYQIETTFISSTIGTLSPGGGVSINTSNAPAANSTILDVNDPTRGVLISRTTPNLITTPATGLIIYNTATNLLNYYNGTQWVTPCAISTGINGATGSQTAIGVAIKTDSSSPHQSAMLDISMANKGVLIPRLTTAQRDLILPVPGLVIYNSSENNIEFYNGSGWYKLSTNLIASPIAGTHLLTGTQIVWNWNTVLGATGYKWSTINDYNSATNMGTDTSKAETGLTPGIIYTRYIWAYNTCGISPVTTLNQTFVYVGQSYGGGKVFYVNETNQQGLISATTDQSTGIQWYNGSYTMTGAMATSIGTGNTNTQSIISSQGNSGSYAAKLCADLVLNGYNDWFLPSVDELNQMYQQKSAIGDFDSAYYWTSSEVNGTSGAMAFIQHFAYGGQGGTSKNYQAHVRAVRIFSIGLNLPTITTTAVSNIGQNTATSGGNVIWDGGANVTTRGVCWSTSSNPTVANSHTTIIGGLGIFTSSLTGLTSNSLYYVRAYAVNSFGIAYGNELTFVTLPATTTTVITNITQTNATSGGNVTLGGSVNVTARGVCWSISSNPTIANSHTSDGTGTGLFISNLTELTANTLYYVRAFASNSSGTSYGNQQSFTTSPSIPNITTTPVTLITLTTATSGGNVIIDGGAAVTVRGVCWSTTPNPSTANSKTTNGTGTGAFSSNLTGLTLNTLYYVRAYATNSAGTAYGNEITFTTLISLGPPVVNTSIASNITSTTIASGGNVTSDGGSTVLFRGVCYGTSPNPTLSNSYTTNGGGVGVFLSNLTGLITNTKYYLRAYAMNSLGTGYGNEITVFTLPTVTTSAITNITQTTAKSGGNVTPGGSVNVTARGVCWSIYPNPTIANSHTSDGTGTGTFISNLTALTANTLYYVRAYAANGSGRSYGNQQTFTTSPTLPIVTTTSVTLISFTTASSGGSISSSGGATVNARGVCWSTTPNPTTANSKTTNGTGTGTFSSSLSGLTLNTLYYVRAYATNTVGTAYGNQVTFTTLLNPTIPTVTTTPITNITLSTATSGGNVLLDGGATIIFRGLCYGTSSNPTLSNSYTTDGNGIGVFVSNLTGLTQNTLYYVRAYAINSVGTAYGNEISFTPTFGIGDYYQGGIVFYIMQPGEGGCAIGPQKCGLISATYDQSGGEEWGCSGISIGTSEAIGSGKTNTTAIVTGCSQTGTAARICNDLVLNNYDDWFLPSTNELQQMYLQKNVIGGFVNSQYWSSSQYDAVSAWYQSFVGNVPFMQSKTTPSYVRAIRSILNLPYYISTNSAYGITQTTSFIGGYADGDGGAPVTARGFCWDLLPNPTIANSKTINGSGTGGFQASLTGLTANTLYYVRAYATNSVGTAYGNEITFSTLPNPILPIVETNAITNITLTTATGGGNITNGGYATVIGRGICWSPTPNPTIANAKTIDGNGTGSFISNLIILTSNTLYYVRAYATNSVGTSYGNEVIFTTLLNPTVPTVTTTSITNITLAAATSGGNVLSDGGASVLFHGVCWNTSPNPTLLNSVCP